MDNGINEKIFKDYYKAFDIVQEFLNKSKIATEINLNSIHYFLGRILAFACLYFSNNDEIKESKYDKREIFFQLFKNKEGSEKFEFDSEKFQNLLMQITALSITSLPDIFRNNNNEIKETKNWNFTKEELEKLYLYLWDSRDFFLVEFNFKDEKNSYDKLIFHPGILGDIFERAQLSKQKLNVQKGIFYTPQSEIKFTVLMAIVNYLNANIPKISKSEKENLSRVILKILIEPREISDQDIKIVMKYSNPLNKLRILDPACGSGTFLYYILNFFINFFKNIKNLKSFQQFQNFVVIYGMDINLWATELTHFRLWALIITQFKENLNLLQKFSQSSIKILQGDFILNNDKLTQNEEGFDIILGNPPYIRHRDIFDPQINSSQKNIIYRKLIRSSLKKIPNIMEKKKGRIDYLIYFFYHGLNILRERGVLAYIVSNSWMNVKYGYYFQEFICKFFKIKQIYDNNFKTFKNAQINTVIAVIEKPEKEKEDNIKNNPQFIKLKIPYNQLLEEEHSKTLSELLLQINIKHNSADSNFKFKIDDFRFFREFSCTQEFILNLKSNRYRNKKEKGYVGYSWANYFFNAPSFYFSLIEQTNSNMLFLGDIANIRRGITTNCNNFFILKEIEDNLFLNGYGDKVNLDPEFLITIITSPKQLNRPKINPSSLKTKLFYCNKSKQELKKEKFIKTLEYINYGEKKKIKIKKGTQRGKYIIGIQNLASFIEKDINKSKKWYALSPSLRNFETSDQRFTKIICQKIFNTTYKFGFCEKNIVSNNTFYEISLKKEFIGHEKTIFNFLLSSLTILSLELEGRTNFGGGVLDTATFNIEDIILLNPKKISTANIKLIEQLAIPLREKIFQPSQMEFMDECRKNLDSEILKLLPIPLKTKTLYESILNIQNSRISRSKTFNASK
ncbi:MAG: Eco57I restriction-modification methylase domain-containing protein [Promethearchaeota archaeon]